MKDLQNNKGKHTDSEISLNLFSIMEDAIDLFIQREYFNFSKTIDSNNVNYNAILKESNNLFSQKTPLNTKKRLLILLAHFGTPESYRILENYLKISEPNMRGWILLSMKECRLVLESSLLDKEAGFISTGLGGKNNKLRYYFIVSSKGGITFSEAHRNLLKLEFEAIVKKYNAEIEEIDIEADYAIIGILIPMDVAVGDVIEEGINECNGTEEFLYFHYYVTNVRKPTSEQILKHIEEIRH